MRNNWIFKIHRDCVNNSLGYLLFSRGSRENHCSNDDTLVYCKIRKFIHTSNLKLVNWFNDCHEKQREARERASFSKKNHFT